MKKKSSQFQKFFKKKSNAAIKEGFRQEKKKWKKEREEYFDEKRRQKFETGGQNSRPQISNPKLENPGEQMPLNKFIAHSGVSSRRDAADMVKLGNVKVNGQVVTEPGHKVSGKDDVRVNGKKIFLENNLVYILLNKP